MIPALRWAAMRAILMFHWEVMDKVKTWDSVHKPLPFWRERRAEAVSNRGPSAYQPNALPLGQTGSRWRWGRGRLIYTYCYTVTTRNHSCIKMGSDESHFNVSLIVRDRVHDGVHKPQYSRRKENRSKIEPRSFCLPTLPLSQTGSLLGNFDLFELSLFQSVSHSRPWNNVSKLS